MTLVTVDLGSSLCKLRAWREAESEPVLTLRADLDAGSETLPAELGGWVSRLGALRVAAVSSVASRQRTALVVAALEAAGARTVSPEPGLEIRCRAPERVGRDRLFAARGALAAAGGACLVVDAGTAVTVDAVRALDPGASASRVAGAFLGGAIAPGPALLARALAEGTANLPRVEPFPGAAALGRDTEEAILAGIGIGFRGAVQELVRRVAAEAELTGAPIVVSGGAREHLFTPEPIPGELIVRPDLVHLGLLAAIAEWPE